MIVWMMIKIFLPQADLDEMSSESRMSEEKAQRAMVDAARLADELRMEQDAAVQLERDRKVVEAQVSRNEVDQHLTNDHPTTR